MKPIGMDVAGRSFQLETGTNEGEDKLQLAAEKARRIYKGEEEIPTSLLLEANISRATAEIEVTPVDNGVKVTCEVSNPATPHSLTISKVLTVLFPPWEVTGSAFPNTVEAGTMVNLTCESSSSVPPANLTWRSDGARIEGAVVRRSQAAFGGTSTISTLQLMTTAEDNGRIFECEADNGLGTVMDTRIDLNVLHSPVWLVSPPPQMDVFEGVDVVITAAAASNPGPVRYI
ncbi:nephrin-like [Penaeus chinensis]|uniref:nephrin-like n=1 Tax=Penaeus chinensis TaxID=139456 RepID=UPI001FB82B41|nr:nephrin-like [Penaeus chinensis]